MTTLTDASFRPASARGQSLKTWFEGVKLLSALLMVLGFGGVISSSTGKPQAAGLFCAGVALHQWRRWQVRRLEWRGWDLLLAGRPDAALRVLEVTASGGSDVSRARSLYGLSLAWMRKGDFERALSLTEKLSFLRNGHTAAFRMAQAPALRATLLALYGELNDARREVEKIQRPMFDKTDYALLAQAVVLCREGRYVEAVKRIQQTPQEYIPEMDVGAVAVIHAFARGRLGGQRIPLRPGCVLPEKPARASGHEYLASAWPELAAWLRGEEAPALASGA